MEPVLKYTATACRLGTPWLVAASCGLVLVAGVVALCRD
jgi:hypothetical protein